MRWDPEPPAATSDTEAWWEATRQRRLLVQRCEACGHHQHYPRAVCAGCGAPDPELVPARGRGTVVSYTEVHRSPDPERFEAPYVVALVRLEEGPVLLTRLVGDGAPACEAPVTVGWHPLGDGRHLPVFTLEGP